MSAGSAEPARQQGHSHPHAPDYFVRGVDGAGVVVDCRPADRIRPRDEGAFEATAEVAAACCETSLAAPLRPGGFTVYVRAFRRAFPDKADHLGEVVEPYEYVAGSEADVLERDLRRKLTVRDRTLRDGSCSGMYHGQPAPTCRYYTPEQLALDVDAE